MDIKVAVSRCAAAGDTCGCFLPGSDVVKEVVPPLIDLLQRPTDLGLLGLVAGQQQLLPQLLQVALVLTEQVHFLHAVLVKGQRQVKDGTKCLMFSSHQIKTEASSWF